MNPTLINKYNAFKEQVQACCERSCFIVLSFCNIAVLDVREHLTFHGTAADKVEKIIQV